MTTAGVRLVTLGRVELLDAGAEGDSLNRRRRKLAVLALLALERRPVPRDRLLEMFWGGQPEAKARHSLSDAISHLRRALGAEAIVSRQDGLTLEPSAVVVDALELEAAAGAGDWERVAALDGGRFLAGVAVEDSPSFDEWTAREEGRIRALAAGAYRAGCECLAERGEWETAATLAARWAAAAPGSARARRFLERARSAVADRESEANDGAVSPPLLERWRVAAAGERQVVVVAGEPESRRAAASALARTARADGATVLEARCYEGEHAPPGRLAGEIVEALLEAPGMAGADPRHLAALRAGRVGDAEAIRAALESVAFEAPLLVRVDEAQLADEASLAVLREAMSGAQGAIALVLGAPPERMPAGWETAAIVPVGEPLTGVRRVARAVGGRPFVVLAALSVLLLAVAIAAGMMRQPPVLAVGAIEDRTGGDTAGTARVLPELLATSLARVSELRILSRARLYEGLAASGGRETPASLAASARAVGATELLEGTLYRRNGVLRLELRQVTLGSGVVRRGLTVEGADAFALADSVTATLARERRASRPATPLRDVTSTSLVARRLYDEGLRRFYASDGDRGASLFEAALIEDPRFAMAAHYLAVIHGGFDQASVRRALRLAERATDRERLLVQATWLTDLNDPRATAVAETLAVRYPDELAGMLLYGRVLESRGDFASAITWFRRAIERDSLGLTGTVAACHACSALGLIKSAALFAGSFRVAEEAMRRLAETYRDDRGRAQAWIELALVRARDERLAEARAAVDSALRRDPSLDPAYAMMQIDVRAGRLREAESRLRQRATANGPSVRLDAQVHLLRVVRLQGRHAEAVALARTTRALYDTLGAGYADGALQEAIARLDHSPRVAAAIFDSLAARPLVGAEFAARNARHRAWMLTHRATALAKAGDTALLAPLADTVQRVGALSGYARDQRLHHYVRALLLEARGDTARAVAELLRARYSPTETYFGARLARLQLALGRPADAITTAQAALRGPLDSQNQYESRTELHEVLARAYDRAGDRGSAARHREMVRRAWGR